MRRTSEMIEKEIALTRRRLELYLKREEEMLGDGVQLYTIGSRNLQRYQTTLSSVQAEIGKLQKKLDQLEAELAGGSARRTVGIVPRDW